MVLYLFVIAIHVVVSFVLIFVILLQAGRGGGLSESFGGSSTQTLFGTKTSVFLMRATAVSAVVYIITCLLLGVMTAHRGRSLVSKAAATVPAGQQGPAHPFQDEPIDY
jgi:preprotein translocase subunit SecG